MDISANLVAWYAAVVATASFFLALHVARRDRAGIAISVGRDFETFGDLQSVYEPGKKLVVVTVANRGRRPVSVKAVTFNLRGKGGHLLLSDSVRSGPLEILEGKSRTFAVEQSDFPFDKIVSVSVTDQVGREWRKRVKWRT